MLESNQLLQAADASKTCSWVDFLLTIYPFLRAVGQSFGDLTFSGPNVFTAVSAFRGSYGYCCIYSGRKTLFGGYE